MAISNTRTAEKASPVADAYPDRKIEALESLRGLAALVVVLHHVPDWNGTIHDVRFLRSGYLLVDLFFVLSGFVIYNAYIDKLHDLRQLIRFQFLRFGRLYPVHLLFLIVAIAIEATKYLAQSRYGLNMPNTAPFKESGGVALLEQIFLLQGVGPTGNALTFNTAAWSISVEFYTYLVFGLIVLFASRFKHVIFLSLACTAVFLLVSRTTYGSTDFVRCIAGFFTGCLTAWLLKKGPALQIHPGISSALFLAMIAFLCLRGDASYNSLMYPLTALLIVSLAACHEGWLNAVLKLRCLTWLGTISYSIYMSHTSVIWVFNQVYRVVLKRPVLLVDDRVTPQLPLAATIVSYFLVVVCVLLLSHLTYRLVEDPFRRQSRRLGFPGGFANRR